MRDAPAGLSHWCIDLADYRVIVDEPTARAVMAACKRGEAWVEFIDLYDTETMLRTERINGVWQSTPETRAASYALMDALRAEHPESGWKE